MKAETGLQRFPPDLRANGCPEEPACKLEARCVCVCTVNVGILTVQAAEYLHGGSISAQQEPNRNRHRHTVSMTFSHSPEVMSSSAGEVARPAIRASHEQLISGAKCCRIFGLTDLWSRDEVCFSCQKRSKPIMCGKMS